MAYPTWVRNTKRTKWHLLKEDYKGAAPSVLPYALCFQLPPRNRQGRIEWAEQQASGSVDLDRCCRRCLNEAPPVEM